MRKFTFLYSKMAVVVFALILSCVAIHTPPVGAASGGLTISPTSIEHEIAAGSSYSSEVLIVNQGELPYSYKVYATPYSVSGEAYDPAFTPIPGAADISTWITLSKTNGLLPMGSQDTISFTVAVPKATLSGSYYATVFAETEDKGASGVVTRKRVGTIIYIKVPGSLTEKGSVAAWSAPWLQKSPLSATLKMANDGSAYYNAKVKVTMGGIFGGSKFTFERQPEVLPQKTRRLDIVWNKGATFGLFKVSGEVDYLGKSEKLPTRYVFVASTPMRILTVSVLLIFVASMILLGVKRVVRK